MALAFVAGDRLEIVAVGDSGVRINGGEPVQDLKPLDDVTARLRLEAWRYFEEAGIPYPERDRLAGLITWKGTRNQAAGQPTARPEVLAEIERRALAVNRAALPDVPEAELLELIHHGIEFGQGKFQNTADRALSYGVIDGFAVPPRHIVALSLPLAEVETIEIYSDGYFSAAPGFGVAAWEAEFQRVEQEDPHKIGRYMSTKGTTEAAQTDDRTYLGIRVR